MGAIGNYLQLLQIDLLDVFEIAVVAILIYRVLILWAGTRAFQILVGLSFLGLLYVVAERMGLFAVHWMLDKFSVYLVLALVILFQTDIRRGLARAGGSFFKGPAGTAEAAINECKQGFINLDGCVLQADYRSPNPSKSC